MDAWVPWVNSSKIQYGCYPIGRSFTFVNADLQWCARGFDRGPVRYNLFINDSQWRHSWLAKSEAPVCIFCLICAWTLSDWWWVVSQHFIRTWDACRVVWTLTPCASQPRRTWVKVKIDKTNKTTVGGVNVGLGIARCHSVGASGVAMAS